MTREIKFRAWVDNAYMYYNDNPRNVFPIDVDDKKDPIMQYTGLKDRNGKEIYEGDIVNHAFQFTANQTTGEVAWNMEGLGWYIERCSAGSYPLSNVVNIEVIGNIYENPELLDGKNE